MPNTEFNELWKCDKVTVDLSHTKGESIKHLFGYPMKLICDLVIGCVFLLGSLVPTFLVPLLIGIVVDAMKQKHDLKTISNYCLYMAIVIFISAIFTFIRAFTFNNMSQKIARLLRYDLFL